MRDNFFGRPVGVLGEGHGTNAATELHRPNYVVGLGVDNTDDAGCQGAGNDIFAVGSHVNVVHRALHRNALHLRESDGIDDIDRAGGLCDAYVHAPAILGDIEVIGPAAQRNPLSHLQGTRIDQVQSFSGLLRDVDTASIGSDDNAVGNFDIVDDPDHAVRARVDDVHAVSRRVRLDYSGLVVCCYCHEGCRQDQACHRR